MAHQISEYIRVLPLFLIHQKRLAWSPLHTAHSSAGYFPFFLRSSNTPTTWYSTVVSTLSHYHLARLLHLAQQCLTPLRAPQLLSGISHAFAPQRAKLKLLWHSPPVEVTTTRWRNTLSKYKTEFLRTN